MERVGVGIYSVSRAWDNWGEYELVLLRVPDGDPWDWPLSEDTGWVLRVWVVVFAAGVFCGPGVIWEMVQVPY